MVHRSFGLPLASALWRFDLYRGELFTAHLQLPSRPPGRTLSLLARPTPRRTPALDDLMRDAHLACDLGGNDALVEQSAAAHAPLLHRAKSRRGRTHRNAVELLLCFTGTVGISQCRTTHTITGSNFSEFSL